MTTGRRWQVPLRIHIATAMIALLVASGSAIGLWSYYSTYTAAREHALSQFGTIVSSIESAIGRLLQPVDAAVDFIANLDIGQARTLNARLRYLGFLASIIRSSPDVAAVYVGYPNGDLFLLRALRTDQDRDRMSAPPEAAFVLQSVRRSQDNGEPTALFVFLDDRLGTIRSSEQPDYATFDPRTRPWYRAAIATPQRIRTAPYIFFTSHEAGITVARQSATSGVVIGADMSLAALTQVLRAQRPSRSTEILLVDQAGLVVAHPQRELIYRLVPAEGTAPAHLEPRQLGEVGSERIRALAAIGLADTEAAAGRSPVELDGAYGFVRLINAGPGQFYRLLMATPTADLTQPARERAFQGLLLSLALVLLFVPFATSLARQISRPLQDLRTEADHITRLNFDYDIPVRSHILEVTDLAAAMDRARRMVKRFSEITLTISRLNDFDELNGYLLSETASIIDATWGAIYLADDECGRLQRVAIHGPGDTAPDMLELADLPAAVRQWIEQRVPVKAAPDAVGAWVRAVAPVPPDATAARHLVLVPLKSRDGTLIGLMTLLRDHPTGDRQLSFLEKLSGFAVVAIETRQLVQAQKRLFDTMTEMIAAAIDAKSPYTGAHCNRVPVLAEMLAEAAHQATAGPYRDFRLTNEDREALHLGAWLHDCGKVTTPEYVIDKSTKLETLYDRIHEIRMRFEVMKREAELRFWQAVAEGGDREPLRAVLDRELAEPDADFAFIALCNEGTEFMGRDQIERVRTIAQRRWTRTLSDRIGISHEELARKAAMPEPALPVAEPVIMDRPDHVLPRRPEDRLALDNQWGIKLKQPDALFNRGELYNLSISRGTLTEEERYKINEHIVQTIIMLSRLSFPRHLRSVPEIAATHHEKMDGTGYPRGLNREQISPMGRMMAIADIFEALTAADRPYRKAKTMAEALKIMSFMVKDQHIDGELFDLFLTSGVWQDYAGRYLRTELPSAAEIEALRPRIEVETAA